MAEPAGPRLLPWGAAMRDALYGPAGFYHRRGGPSAHFRTAVHAGPRYAEAVRRLARLVDEALGRPDPFLVVDLGAGRGELGARLAEGAPRGGGCSASSSRRGRQACPRAWAGRQGCRSG